MNSEHRKDERFDDIGKVEAPNLCVFPGILEDISALGGKIRFPISLDVELNKDVDLMISPSNGDSTQPIHLIAHAKWFRKEDDFTQIGFKFLRSPGTNMLNSYIQKLSLLNAEFEEEDQFLCSLM